MLEWTIAEDFEERIDAEKRKLASQGVFLRFGRDFQTFADHIGREPKRANIHEQFDPNGDMDGAADAFWICGFSEDGDLLHTQAAHLLELGERSIADHIYATLPNYYPKKPDVIRSSIEARPGPNLSRLKGRVVYHGEMWVSDDLRDLETPATLIRLGMLTTLHQWDPDAMFGLMAWQLACRGFNMRIGYHHSEPMTLSWQRVDEDSRHQVWAVYMERDDLKFMLELPVLEMVKKMRRSVAA